MNSIISVTCIGAMNNMNVCVCVCGGGGGGGGYFTDDSEGLGLKIHVCYKK
jgi:hypothetical protein